MWVKICANTNLEDSLLAVELGADALGFVFAESRRQVTAAQVARITPHLPPAIERVGVFHRHEADEIVRIVQEAGLTTVQLHGGVNHALRMRLRELLPAIRLIQTLHWVADGSADSSSAVAADLEEIARSGEAEQRVLVDSRVGASGGGTGVPFDWKTAGEVFATSGHGVKVIAAGGLRPENVAEAIRLLRPWGVDVASGVEATAGRKDPDRLADFLRIAKSDFTS